MDGEVGKGASSYEQQEVAVYTTDGSQTQTLCVL